MGILLQMLNVYDMTWFICVAVLVYILLPLWIMKFFARPLVFDCTPIGLEALPEDIAGVFEHSAIGLDQSGFQLLGLVTHAAFNKRQQAYLALWTNPTRNDSAQITGVDVLVRRARRVRTVVAFRTRFKDGLSIVTNNSASPSALPDDPNNSTVSCPGMEDIALLYRFHCARVARDAGGRIATIKSVEDVASSMAVAHQKNLERLVAAGYFRRSFFGKRYVPTVMGAYIMAWRMIPPLRQIRQWRWRRQADTTLRDLGFGGLAAFRSAQGAPSHPDIGSPN